jgi:alpha-glucan, water dikinase
MAVLVQKIIPADYAFVIHTKNPSTNDENELFGEMVIGMGETLVGNYEGQPFSFTYNKSNNSYDIKSYPNKGIALKNEGFIFRSDSNTEDLEGFAGAGIFDSVPMVVHQEQLLAYHKTQVMSDHKFDEYVINKLAEMGMEVEKLYNNYPQDIEGVVYNNEFYIVQARPQV